VLYVAAPGQRLDDLLDGQVFIGVGIIGNVNLEVKYALVETRDGNCGNVAEVFIVVKDEFLIILKTDESGNTAEGESDMRDLSWQVLK